MIDLGGKFGVKPDGADRGRILVARAACRKRLVRDGHEVVGGFAAESAKTKVIFADCAVLALLAQASRAAVTIT